MAIGFDARKRASCPYRPPHSKHVPEPASAMPIDGSAQPSLRAHARPPRGKANELQEIAQASAPSMELIPQKQ